MNPIRMPGKNPVNMSDGASDAQKPMIKRCVICGAEYKAPPSDKRVTCGNPACVTENKRRTHAGKRNQWSDESKKALSAKGHTDNLKKGALAAQLSPKSGRFETNQAAKRWLIKSPDNQIYEVRNLNNWARSHCALFGKLPTEQSAIQIASGLRQVKRIMQGKRKDCVPAYLGWTLLDFDD